MDESVDGFQEHSFEGHKSSSPPDELSFAIIRHQPHFTPELLYENPIFRENASCKRIQDERRRIRELSCQNTMHQEKIRQLEIELSTVDKSLQLQIQMYRQMSIESENDKLRHINHLQQQFSQQMQTLILEREEEAKVVQAEKEELQAEIAKLKQKISEQDKHLANGHGQSEQLRLELAKTKLELSSTEDKLIQSQRELEVENQRRQREVETLESTLQQQVEEHRRQLNQKDTDNSHQMQLIQQRYKADLDNFELKRQNELQEKSLEVRALETAFEQEARRLTELVNSKDRFNSSLMADLNKEKQKVVSLTKHYDLEISKLTAQKQHLLRDMEIVENQRAMYKVECQQLELEVGGIIPGSRESIEALLAQSERTNAKLTEENIRLASLLRQYEDTNILGRSMMENKLANQDAATYQREIRKLRELLLESAQELENCKGEFIRLKSDKEQLQRSNRMLEDELKTWKDSVYSIRNSVAR